MKKGEIISQAFAELAIAEYEFDVSPEEKQAALVRLDAMMASWDAEGLSVPYAFAADSGTGSLDDESGLPQIANEAAYTELAIRTAASKGKVAPVTLRASAARAKAALSSAIVRGRMQQQQLSSWTPRGAGQKPWRQTQQPFLSPPDTSQVKLADDGGGLSLGG